METQKIICRLCLKVCDSFKALEGNTKDILDKLLPKISLAAIQESVICANCAEMLKKCFDFKMMCVNGRNNIIPFVNNTSSLKSNPVDISLRVNENGTPISEEQNICGLCINLVKNCSKISIDVERKDVMLQKVIEQCLPELDLNIRNSAVCAPCHESLEMCFRLVTNCLIVEEKIKKYCETLNIDNAHQVQLSSLLQLEVKDATKIEVEDHLVDMEISTASNIFKLERISCDDRENIKEKLEYEHESYVDMKFNNEEQFTPKNLLTCREESHDLNAINIEEILRGKNEIKQEVVAEIEEQKFLTNEDVEIKTEESDFNRLEDGIVLPQPEGIRKLHGRQKCLISNLEDIKHTPTNEDVLETGMYQCDCCSFQTKSKHYLKTHSLKHKDPLEIAMYKCNSCPYQTKEARNLKNHLLVHKNSSDVTMYKCDSCSYQTKYQVSLKNHLLVHKDLSEVTTYKCELCPYQTKHKYYLKKHTLNHKDPSEVTMYKCDSCSFLTKYERNIKKHLLVHSDLSQTTMYKCDSCSYQTKSTMYLKRHLLVHKNPSEVTMYKCDSCSFQTKRKMSLKKHVLLLHKDPSGMTTHKCNSCSFQTKRKSRLKEHMLMHANLEVRVYTCDSCSFQTISTKSMETHLLVHKDPSEVKMYKCASCSFQTKYERNLKEHLKKHKNPSEVKTYKCDSCSFQTKRKGNLKGHMLWHAPLEERVYKCSSCPFQTQRKSSLTKHLLVHKVPPTEVAL